MGITDAVAHANHLPLVLLVDRDADTRRMYAECFRSSQLQVDEAEDGREALAKAITLHPDVVITETRLTGMDGFTLCTLLRKDSATADIPVVFVTGDAFEHDLNRARAAGAETVLIKPCLPADLLAEVQRLFAMSKELRARSRAATTAMAGQIARSDALMSRTRASAKRITMSHALHRHDTTTPPVAPPALVCPNCDMPLQYARSHIGGVSARHLEQWDYYECAAGCGTFQYRERTRRLRKI
jgi:CheY-like chemotaxis protein